MDTRQLANFLKIAELGSISRAAEALGLAQPSLSQQVLRLEDEVGFKLFRRTARGVSTTEAGEILKRCARQVLEITEGATAAMRQAAEQAEAKVVLAMPFSISRLVAVPLTEAVMSAAPNVGLRLREAFSGEVRAMLLDGGADLGLLYDVEPLEGLSVRRLAREELYLIGPPGRLSGIEHTQSTTVRELADLPLIVPGPAHGLRKALEREAARVGVRLTVASEIDSLEHIVGLVADGHGFSILPLSAISGELGRGAVSAARIEGAFRRTLCLARPPKVAARPAVRRVEELLVDQLARVIGKGRWLAEPDAG